MNGRRLLCWIAMASVCAVVLPAHGGVHALAAPPGPRILLHSVPAAVTSGVARFTGRYSASRTMHITVGLLLRNRTALDRFLSVRHARPLTLAEANASFNPTANQQDRVVAWLRAHGLTVTRTYPNHLLVDARGSAGQVERLLHVQLNAYRVGMRSGTVQFYAPASNPVVDGSVADVVQTITGLDDFPRIIPNTNGTAHNATPYYPQDFANAYDVNPLWNAGYTGSGQHIGITLWMVPPSDTELANFASLTGAGAPTTANGRLQVIPVDGGSTKADDGEAGMDIEYSSGLAPGATIDYYQSTVGSNGYASQTGLEDALNLAGTDANNNGQITNSWDYCSSSTDPFETTTESILASNAATGHDYLFASGDNGSACHDVTTGFYQDPYPFFPASSPYVTSVGATEFSSTVNGGYPGEVAHSYSGCSPLCGLIYPSGSGGGYSNAFPRASWQIDPNANRAFPDVAADGDPNTPACVVYGSNTSCTSIAGTSLSSPLWAGMLAVVNSYLLGNGEPATGFADAALYSMATATQPYPAYHDITSGTNGQYSCAPGWDPVTGLGSPDLYNLARDLAGATPGPTATPTNTPTPTTTPLPTATATLVPSATATSTPTNTATIGPTSTSTPIPPLGAPQSLAAAPASGKKGAGIALTWKAPASNGGSAITGYRIYRGTSSGAETLLTTVGVQLSYTDRSTSSGRRYFYKVSALNPNEGPLSNEASATAR